MTKEEAIQRLEDARLAKVNKDGEAYGVIIGWDVTVAMDGARIPEAQRTWHDSSADPELIEWMTADETDDANNLWHDAHG